MTQHPSKKSGSGIIGIAGLTEGNNLPALNSVHEVNKIVRRFASEVINSGFSGNMGQDQFVAAIETRIKALNRLFLGEFSVEASQYHRGVWNTPGNLGQYLLLTMNRQGDSKEAVSLLFSQLGTQVMQVMRTGARKSEDEVKAALEQACHDARDMLLGLKSDDFDD